MTQIHATTNSPPPVLIKVMERRWAEKFIECGSMRFGSLEFYCNLENSVLGDPFEGKGIFAVGGIRHTVESINPVYAWCTSKPNIAATRVQTLAREGGYNCVVYIRNPRELISTGSEYIEVEISKITAGL